MTRVKFADLTSGVGALAVGMGLGALFAMWLAPTAVFILTAGVIAHGFGMWNKHRLENENGIDAGLFVLALYWLCWILLGGVLVSAFVSR